VEPSGRARVVGAVAVLTGCCAAAVLAAASSGAGTDDSRIRLPAFGALLSVTVFVLALCGLVFVLLSGRGSDRGRRRAREHRPLSGLLVVAAAVAALFVFRPDPRAEEVPASTSTTEAGTADDTAGGRDDDRGTSTVLLVVLGAGALLAYLGARRLTSTGAGVAVDRSRGPADEVGDVIDEMIDAIRRDPDPRRAVIAAYARMEQALAGAGVPRRPAEAPLEYLGRALRHLDAGRPAVTRLTELFAQAMFSTHAFDRSMQDDAVDALVAVRDDLRRVAVA
jgi:hypothetical protein